MGDLEWMGGFVGCWLGVWIGCGEGEFGRESLVDVVDSCSFGILIGEERQ